MITGQEVIMKRLLSALAFVCLPCMAIAAFSDGFSDVSKINAVFSANWGTDARQIIYSTRSRGGTYLNANFNGLPGWGGGVSGTGSKMFTAPGESGTGNPSDSYGHKFSTGSQIGSGAWDARSIPLLPTSYGFRWQIALINVSSSMDDSAFLAIQNTVDNKAVVLRYNTSGMYVQDSNGANIQLSTHSNVISCEWWFENHDNGDGTNTITTYAGTQKVSTVTVTLPTGNSANAGLVMFAQYSGANANQTSETFGFEIGETQLSDDMAVAWKFSAPFNSTSVNYQLLFEDVSVAAVIGTDLWCEDTFNNGTSWGVLPLIDKGEQFKGVIDYTKPVKLITSSRSGAIAQGVNVIFRCHLSGKTFGAFTGLHAQFTSIY